MVSKMALLQISEPESENIPHKHNIAIGIDLGTTNSLVAVVKSGKPVVLSNEQGANLIPSAVYYPKETDIPIVGNNALDYQFIDPVNTITSIKRFMGLSSQDIQPHNYPYIFAKDTNIVEITTNHGYKNPIQISANILSELKRIANTSLGEEPIGAVITVPAYFNETQRQATKQAATLAGINVLRLLNEPTAAAIAYGLDNKKEGTFLIYDLGGGTLDVSILKLRNEVFEVLAVNGNTHLGGDDFDFKVLEYLKSTCDIKQVNAIDNAILYNLAKSAKELLSKERRVDLNTTLSNGTCIAFSFTRDEFETLSKTLVDQAISPIHRALHDAKLKMEAIDEIVMVGGSSRLPNIRQAVSTLFDKEILCSIDPDKAIAIGAAIQADMLAGNQNDNWLLLDVTPLSLGIETMGGLVEKIIPRNSTIPIIRAQEFTTYIDGQTKMSIHVLQGEREMVQDCRSLAKFSLHGIPPMAAGLARIKVSFQIDADGLLTVSASETSTNTSSTISVKPSFGLNSDTISDMLKTSVRAAKEDMLNRQLVEATTDAKLLINTIEKALSEDSKLLNPNELSAIQSGITQLSHTINDKIEPVEKTLSIKKLMTELNTITTDFATRRMDKIISNSLVNQKLESII